MTITVANTTLTNTFEYLVNRTSELADAMTNKVVTTDSNTTPGNAVITGTFSPNVYIVGNSASNTSISAPNTEQKSSGSYFLNANGSWSSIVANNGIIANSSGIFVNANTGIVVNTAGVFVNSNYIGTLTGTSTSNNAAHLGGVPAASYVQNTDSRTLSGNLAFSGANVNFTSNRVGVGNAEIRYVSSPNAMIFASDGTTERMRIDSAGNLLVGNTTSRGSRFEVERTDSDSSIADFKTNNAAGDVIIRSSGGLVRVRAQGTNDMALMTSGTVRMLIAANSNVGIANTTPAQTLTVDGTIGGTIIATQAEAEAGSSTTKLMTPERVLQSLALNALDGIVVRTFTTTGQSPYVPTTGMKYCLVFATGGGGGGGGSDCIDTTAASAGAGGGAGGTAIKYYTAAQIGANAAFAVGGGGTAGGATGTDGGAGGTTTFTPSGGGVALSATGGTLGNGGGQPSGGVATAAGVGGTPTGGDFNIPGGDGQSGAGHFDASFAIAGSGGNSFWGGGGRGAARTSTTSAGQPGGINTGAGGGGSATVDSTTGSVGGAGGAGVVFIMEFI